MATSKDTLTLSRLTNSQNINCSISRANTPTKLRGRISRPPRSVMGTSTPGTTHHKTATISKPTLPKISHFHMLIKRQNIINLIKRSKLKCGPKTILDTLISIYTLHNHK